MTEATARHESEIALSRKQPYALVHPIVNTLAADARLGVEAENARDNLAAQTDTHQLTRRRNRAGLTSELDVTQARSQVATTEAQIPEFEARMKIAIHALAVLAGRYPGGLPYSAWR